MGVISIYLCASCGARNSGEHTADCVLKDDPRWNGTAFETPAEPQATWNCQCFHAPEQHWMPDGCEVVGCGCRARVKP